MSQQVTINYNIEYPEERRAALRALKSTDAYLVLWTMHQELFRAADQAADPAESEYAEKWLNVFNQLLDKYAINIYEELD